MLRRLLRFFVTAGIAFLVRHPTIRAIARAGVSVVPGLRPLLRRLMPRPTVARSPLAELESLLRFDRTRGTTGPDDVVTVEHLFVLARPN